MIKKICCPLLIILGIVFVFILFDYISMKKEAVPVQEKQVNEVVAKTTKDSIKLDLKEKLQDYMKEGYSESDTKFLGNANRLIPDAYPVKSEKIISQKYSDIHNGIDWVLKTGEPVYATAAGHVITAGNDEYYGNLVIIDHLNGYQTYYGHLQKIMIKEDSFIEKGQILGAGGSTGYSTGPHLHYSISSDNDFIDPVTLWEK